LDTSKLLVTLDFYRAPEKNNLYLIESQDLLTHFISSCCAMDP